MVLNSIGVDYLLRVNEIETQFAFILSMMSKYNIPEWDFSWSRWNNKIIQITS